VRSIEASLKEDGCLATDGRRRPLRLNRPRGEAYIEANPWRVLQRGALVAAL